MTKPRLVAGLVLLAMVALGFGTGLALGAGGAESAAGIASISAGDRSVTVDPGLDLKRSTKAFATLLQQVEPGVTVERVRVRALADRIDIYLTGPATRNTKVSWGVLNGTALVGPPGPPGSQGEAGPQGPEGDPASATTVLCPGCALGGSNLSGANLVGAYLVDADLAAANLSGSDLRGANLVGVSASGVDLSQADLSGADLRDSASGQTVFSGGDFSGAKLTGADASGPTEGAVFSLGDFTGADLSNANLQNAAFTFVDFTDASLLGAQGVETAALASAIWSNTTCPDGTNSDSNGNTCAGHLTP